MSITSRKRQQKSAWRRGAAVTAISLAFLITCHWAYAAEQDRSAPISFDEFIDQTTGDEVQQDDLAAQMAYRGKRVYKSLFRWIDRRGYYSDFIKRFQQWCDASGGRYVRNRDLDADCFDGESDRRWFGGYTVQIVPTATHAGGMTAGYATFYFFRQQEMEVIRKSQLARNERAQDLAAQHQIAKFNAQAIAREQVLRDLPIVKMVGQKICRTVQEAAQSTVYLIDGRQTRPQYFLTAFTENTANDKIQLRIAAIREKLPTGFSNVDRLLLDGDVVLQNNAVIWDDPLLWHPCD